MVMTPNFDFENLFVLDLANNHQGSLEHGIEIIRDAAKLVKKYKLNAAVKFQFRVLESFIHKDFQNNKDFPLVERLNSTKLSWDDYSEMVAEVKKHGLVAMCTPFDEASVDKIVEIGFDVVKIASCSAKDWPLLEKVASSGLPVLFSTGGLEMKDIDNLVSFFDHKGTDTAIMHCVSVYPTPDNLCNLSNIAMMKERYGSKIIGWSTHEPPEEIGHVQIAYALGARMFERHIGKPTDEITLNKYSSDASQLDNWFAAYQKAIVLCGSYERQPTSKEENASLISLKRGAWAKKKVKKGDKISQGDVYYSIPMVDDQFEAGDVKEDAIAKVDIEKDAKIGNEQVENPKLEAGHYLKNAVHEIKAILNIAQIDLGTNFEVEYSHHMGAENFTEVGAAIINCINREYCKKILVQLPGQKHPLHYHKRKEETFQVLWGEFYSEIDGRVRLLKAGDTALVLPGLWHRFWTETGVVFEEVSTTHFNNDSVYKDPEINKLERAERKTVVSHWGRYQV